MKQRNRILTISALATGLAVAGISYAVAAADGSGDGGPVADSGLQSASAAALAETGGGTVTDVEADDGGYDVNVRLDDGTEIEVDLDGAFAVVRTDRDQRDGPDGDDLPISDTDRQRASDAALAEAGSGAVADVERDADGYDVEVRLEDGTELEIDLGVDFGVLHTERDDD
jgi:uncharacterized membrane protein YkoI